METVLPAQIEVVRYRFVFKVTNPVFFNDYAGSALRGAFGHALKRVSCMTRDKECKSCVLYRTCPYPALFAAPAPVTHHLQKFSEIPAPYIIEPPAWGKHTYTVGEELSFDMVLIGSAVSQLPLISYAWRKAFEKQVGKGNAVLVDIQHCAGNDQKSILENNLLQEHATILNIPDHLPPNLTLNIETPLRLQKNGKPLFLSGLEASVLFSQLMRRVALLSEFHLHTPLALDFYELKKQLVELKNVKHLRWLDWTRYSTRQQQYMQFGGVVGQWHFYDLPEVWRKMLYLGQWFHIGKNATFGLGKYQLEYNT